MPNEYGNGDFGDMTLRFIGITEALEMTVAMGASDLHLTVGRPPMVRIDGSLSPLPGATIWNQEMMDREIRKIISPTKMVEFESKLELDVAYTGPDSNRYRVNLYRQQGNLGAAFRVLPSKIKSLTELGMPEDLALFATLPRGLVLVTGPTGSGKSTTLAAIINEVNISRPDHIMTVEDPIEFLHESKKALIHQREVGADTTTFSEALKHVLRQDPDVILIGEMRDLETISAALTAAETGHLVFATLHTQDAGQTIDRIIDVFPPHQQAQVRTQLAATLKGVVCQNLVPMAGGPGRAVATEVLHMTPAISNMIRENKTFQIRSAMQSGREMGMHTMDQSLATLVKSGKVARDVAADAAHDFTLFEQLLAAPNYA
jgi:twitching motility protein PilT